MGTQQTNADKKRVCTPSIGATKEKQTVQMVYDSPYTVYNIEEEVDLHGGTLLLPEGCTLNFRGGSFRNGILKGNRTRICRSDNYIFKDNLQLEGTFYATLSPYNLGYRVLPESVNYDLIQRLHQIAFDLDIDIDYSQVGEIHIEIGADQQPVLLKGKEDFRGTVFHVTNHSKNTTLFQLYGAVDPLPVRIDKKWLSGIDYTAVSDFLPDRNYLLIVKDNAPWTRRIVSGTYRDIYRKDLLYVVHGMSLNTPVFNYESEESAPECVYLDVTERGPSYIRNLRINRKKSSFRTVLFDIEYAVDLRMSDVEIYTEKDESVYPGPDRAMFFSDCANLLVENVRIFNTYASDTSIYTHGYGIEMNNCYNSIFRNLTATDAGWGGVWYQ